MTSWNIYDERGLSREKNLHQDTKRDANLAQSANRKDVLVSGQNQRGVEKH